MSSYAIKSWISSATWPWWGRPILGSFKAHKSGHEMNNKLFKRFLADPQAWQLITPNARTNSDSTPRLKKETGGASPVSKRCRGLTRRGRKY